MTINTIFQVRALSTNPPDPAEYECHGQKAVLLPTGWADIPYLWHPHVVELGLYRIGEFFIICKTLILTFRLFILQKRFPANSQQWRGEKFEKHCAKKSENMLTSTLLSSLQDCRISTRITSRLLRNTMRKDTKLDLLFMARTHFKAKKLSILLKKNVFNQLTRKRQSAWQEKCFLVRLVVIRQILLRSQLLIFSSVLKGLA